MAVAAGYTGSISITGGYSAAFTSWSVNPTAALVRTDGFGDAWATNIGGKKSWSAQATARVDGTDNVIAVFGGAAVAVTFETTTGVGYGGNAVVSDVSVSVNHDGEDEVTFQLVGSGALTPDTTT